MKTLAQNAKLATQSMRLLDNNTRKIVLLSLANIIRQRKSEILEANKLDMSHSTHYPESLRDRLLLDEKRIEAMAKSVEEIAEQPDVVGLVEKEFKRADGLEIKRVRIPIGVILMVFESRPNVVIDAAALAIKSSNCMILKGGKEAINSNEILGSIVSEAIQGYLPLECLQFLSSSNRDQVHELLQLNELIDVVVPRGGEGLIRYVYEHAKMTVIAHYKGLCHLFVDESADSQKAVDIVVNAKTQRTGVCNAVETLIIDKRVLKTVGKDIIDALVLKGTKLNVDEIVNDELGTSFTIADETDWNSEYLENTLSIKIVNSLDEAIEHIRKYGSHHTEGIISENDKNIEKFILSVDASCTVVNASTRFNDGGELGLGAELGISTSKIGSYGPMGAEQMTIYKYLVIGDGHVRK